jgi:hypothetical protein
MEECFLHYRQDNEASSINNPGKVYCVCDEYDEMARFLKERPLDRPIIEPVMVRIKFDTYCWNYERLSEPLQAEFIQRFSGDFRNHLHESMLRKEYFEWYKWRRVHHIMEDPERYHDIQVKIKAGELSEPYEWDGEDSTINPAMGRRDSGLLRGGLYCILDHGLGYTIKYGFKKVFRRVRK